MTGETARAGLAGLLTTIPGLRVIDRDGGPVDELPPSLVLFEGRETALTLGRGASVGRMRVVLLAASAESDRAHDVLDRYIGPSGPRSIEAAVSADSTWGGSVDDGRLVSIDGVGPRKLRGGAYLAADLHFRYVKAS